MAKWERWSVNKEVPAKLELQALIDDKDGLKLVFTDADENIYIHSFLTDLCFRIEIQTKERF